MDLEDLEDLEWNEEDELYFTPRGRRAETKTCKYCGQTGLKWNDDSGNWRLVNVKGDYHMCQEPDLTDGFTA